MSVQINCSPVKGRDCFRHPHQRALLAGVQRLPAHRAMLASADPHTVPRARLAQCWVPWLRSLEPGPAAVCQGWGWCPGTADTSVPYLGRASLGLGAGSASFPHAGPSWLGMRYWDLSSCGLSWCFSSSVAQFSPKRRHSLVLNCFHLVCWETGQCQHVREAAVLQQGQKNLKALLAS